MERLSKVVSAPPSEVAPLESLAPFEDGFSSHAVPELNRLVKATHHAADDAERRALCGQINKVLATMQQPNETQARSLVGWLDAETFHGLSDEKSTPCRAVAVGALLRMGYPHALEVDPDDLEFFRQHQHARLATRPTPLTRVLAGLAATSYGALTGLLMSEASLARFDGQGPSWPVLAMIGCTTIAALSSVVMAWGPGVRWLSLAARVVGTAAALSLLGVIGPEALLGGLGRLAPETYAVVAMTATTIAAAVSRRTAE
jgi:hypothetical protein